jgi:hypothetical protein
VDKTWRFGHDEEIYVRQDKERGQGREVGAKMGGGGGDEIKW